MLENVDKFIFIVISCALIITCFLIIVESYMKVYKTNFKSIQLLSILGLPNVQKLKDKLHKAYILRLIVFSLLAISIVLNVPYPVGKYAWLLTVSCPVTACTVMYHVYVLGSYKSKLTDTELELFNIITERYPI